MNINIKRKKSSFSLGFITLILGLVIALLYFLALSAKDSGSIDFNSAISLATSFFTTLDFSDISTYMILTMFFLPLVGGVLALFCRLARFINVITFSSFLLSAVTFFFSYGTGIFDFMNVTNSLISISFIVSLIGLLLSFINLEKSK